MSHRTVAATITLGALLFSASAAAQDAGAVPTADPPAPPAPAAPCGLRGGPCEYPHLAIALEGGVAIWNESSPFSFKTGIGSGTSAGPSWGLRVGVEIYRWLAIDAHYIGMNNSVIGMYSPGGSVSLLTNAATLEVRLTVPVQYVQPYFFTGAGVYSTSVTGSASAKAANPFFGSTEPGVPVGLGLAIPVMNDALSVGAEVTYHRFFGESLSADDTLGGGDLTTFTAVVRGRL